MSQSSSSSLYLLAAKELQKNEQQWAAFESKGHCVVLAGPGSGKTKVLTAKMARMLAEDVKAPRGIACITYNNQCAKELKARLSRLGIDECARVFIGTVHSFCLREIIIPYAKLAGLPLPDPLRIATPSEGDTIFRNAVGEVLGGDENPQRVRTPFDEFRRTVLDRNSKEWRDNDRYAPLIERYDELLAHDGKIDFDGMVINGLKLIKENDWVRRAIKAKFPVLVVDEYQDLGVPLHEIVISLCMDGGVRLFAVGDPDQSIYGFTGARPSLLNELSRTDNIERVQLRLNYRCGKDIIEASTTALAEQRDFESADNKVGVVIDHCCPKGFDEQVSYVVNTIIPESLSRRAGRKLGDIGVLYKDQHDGGKIAKAVEEAGIEYVRFDGGIPYPRTPVTMWLEDCASWCAGGWSVGEPKLSALLRAWMRFTPSLSGESAIMDCRRRLVKFLFESRKPEIPLRAWIESFVKPHKLHSYLKTEPTMADECDALIKLYEACKNKAPLAKYTVANFGGQRGSPDRLNLTTIHSAKGLEYDVVIMLGLEQGKIPYYTNYAPPAILEERRLFYVAMTRARHEVHLLWSGWYLDPYGRERRNGKSQFVNEAMSKIGK